MVAGMQSSSSAAESPSPGSSSSELLKYFRLGSGGGTAPGSDCEILLERENVSVCKMLDEQALVVGTQVGMLHIISTGGKVLRSYKAHDCAINDISVDSYGTVACCSDNGTIVIYPQLGNVIYDGTYNNNNNKMSQRPSINAHAPANAADEKPTIVHLQEPVKSICLENSTERLHSIWTQRQGGTGGVGSGSGSGMRSTSNSNPKEKRTEFGFISGGAQGQMWRHRVSWYSQKREAIFAGAGSAVSSISWLGSLIAWADATQVRIMDVSTLTAVCYLDSPAGMGTGKSPSFPCTLCWASDHDLFIGWADSFRHLELRASSYTEVLTTAGGGSQNPGLPQRSKPPLSGGIFARTVSDWQTDFLICGMSAFDAEHVVLLGYCPPLDGAGVALPMDNIAESPEERERAGSQLSAHSTPPRSREQSQSSDQHPESPMKAGGSGKGNGLNAGVATNELEVHICALFSGQPVASDSLQLHGHSVTAGPWAYKMCSTYDTAHCMKNAMEWKIASGGSGGGGGERDHGNWPPQLFIVGPQDLVCATVRDVNDNIGQALQEQDLAAAVELAASNPAALVKYNFPDLLFLHVSHLLELGEHDRATVECVRLIRETGQGHASPISETATLHLWERFVYAYVKYDVLHLLAPHLPSQRPFALSEAVCSFVLEEFMVPRAREFAMLVQEWAPAPDDDKTALPLYDTDSLLSKLDTFQSTSPWHRIAKAHIHRMRGEWDLSLDCYLESTVFEDDSNSSSSGDSSGRGLGFDYSPVFAMITRHDLYAAVQERLWAVSRLDCNRACEFFVKQREQFPIPAVVQQLRKDRKCLHKYLDRLYVTAPVEYNVQDYAEYHAMQVSLYAEFAPDFVRKSPAREGRVAISGVGGDAVNVVTGLAGSNGGGDSMTETDTARVGGAGAGLMCAILNSGKKTAVVSPDEDDDDSGEGEGRGSSSGSGNSAFLHFLTTSAFAPLDIALAECAKRKPPLYTEMVYIHTRTGNMRLALDLLLREIGDVQAAIEFAETNDPSLWAYITEFCLSDGQLLGQVLDYAGISPHVSPATILAKVPPRLQLPRLRSRLMLLNNLCAFRQFVTDRCNEILAEDTVGLQRGLNQLKRRAVKVDPVGARCSTCAKPVFMLTAVQGPVQGNWGRSDVDKGNRKGKNTAAQIAPKAAQQLLHSTSGGVWGPPITAAHQTSGVLVFGNKLVFHQQCYQDLVQGVEYASN